MGRAHWLIKETIATDLATGALEATAGAGAFLMISVALAVYKLFIAAD